MRTSRIFLIALAAVVLLAVADVSQANAQVRGDLRVGLFTKGSNASLGAGILGQISPNLYLNPMIEYVFIDGATSLFMSGDGHYDFHVADNTDLWLGGGLGVQYVKVRDVSDTNVGLDLLTGVALVTNSSVYPYIQFKGFLSETTNAQLAVGLRF